MKAFSKEFDEAMDAFEKNLPYGLTTDKVSKSDRDKTPNGYWYNNGRTNELFKMFLNGYAFALCSKRLNIID